MIDKSIRQHYQDGEKVNQLTKWKDQLMAIPGKKITPASIAKGVVKRGVAKKLAGTGLLSSLGPIGALLAMFLVNKGSKYASEKWGEGGVKQAYTSGMTGFGSPQEGRELRVLENRRANMLQRKDEGKNYSEKNLDIVTRAIAEAKGLDINNPNEMKNIDKPITQIRTEKSITEPRVIPKTPEVKIPHLLGKDPVEDIITERPEDLPEHLTWIPPGKDTMEDIITPPVWNPGIAAQEEAIAKAERDAAAARAPISVPVPAHISGGGGNGGGSGGGSGQAAPGTGASGPPGRNYMKGGRIDKPLMGRSRDI